MQCRFTIQEHSYFLNYINPLLPLVCFNSSFENATIENNSIIVTYITHNDRFRH